MGDLHLRKPLYCNVDLLGKLLCLLAYLRVIFCDCAADLKAVRLQVSSSMLLSCVACHLLLMPVICC